jgi:hypothetical protein
MKELKFFRKAFVFTAILSVVLGMVLAGCDNSTNGDDDLFAGTWIGTGEREGSTMVATNGSYTESSAGKEIIRGTYSVAGNTVTMTMVQLNMIVFGGTDQWSNWDDLDDVYKGYLLNSDTFLVTIQDNSLLDDEGMVGFIRQ